MEPTFPTEKDYRRFDLAGVWDADALESGKVLHRLDDRRLSGMFCRPLPRLRRQSYHRYGHQGDDVKNAVLEELIRKTRRIVVMAKEQLDGTRRQFRSRILETEDSTLLILSGDSADDRAETIALSFSSITARGKARLHILSVKLDDPPVRPDRPR